MGVDGSTCTRERIESRDMRFCWFGVCLGQNAGKISSPVEKGRWCNSAFVG